LEADKDASDTFKNGFNGREIALDTIKGKSFHGQFFLALVFEPEAALLFLALLLLRLLVFLFLLCHWLFFQALLLYFGVIEAEAVEIEGFILNFEGTIENAKNVARYAKEVVGTTGVTLTKK
jgi:hypothetical protein